MTIFDPIRPRPERLPTPSFADAMLMDVARRVQLSPTKHDEAQQHFEALCSYVDRPGSPLQDKVIACYPGGSFATGTAIASSVSKDQHDVDVVMELDVPTNSDPKWILDLLFEAINAEPGSRYHGRVTRNSRCVTVEYDDGVRVDLMPISRLTAAPEKAGHLFHFKQQPLESYHKPVNPWGFADHFNAQTAYDPVFAAIFESRSLTDGRCRWSERTRRTTRYSRTTRNHLNLRVFANRQGCVSNKRSRSPEPCSSLNRRNMRIRFTGRRCG